MRLPSGGRIPVPICGTNPNVVPLHSQQDYKPMNQTIEVIDVIEPWHTISRTTVEPTMWQVRAHGDNGFDQLIDLYDTLDEAEKEYPYAVTIPSSRYCTCSFFTALNLK